MTTQQLLALLKPPFKYDYEGSIILNREKMIVIDVRGYKLIQDLPNASEIEIQFGELIASLLNEAYNSMYLLTDKNLFPLRADNGKLKENDSNTIMVFEESVANRLIRTGGIEEVKMHRIAL